MCFLSCYINGAPSVCLTRPQRELLWPLLPFPLYLLSLLATGYGSRRQVGLLSRALRLPRQVLGSEVLGKTMSIFLPGPTDHEGSIPALA